MKVKKIRIWTIHVTEMKRKKDSVTGNERRTDDTERRFQELGLNQKLTEEKKKKRLATGNPNN